MNVQNIFTVITKELKGFFEHIGGYLLLFLMLFVIYFIFVQTFFLNQTASLREMFTFIVWPLAVFIPAVTMGSFANEKDRHTIEYLLTKPISTLELLLGKIFALTAFGFFPILLTTPLVYFIKQIGNIDLGETFAAYLGTLILILAMTSLGVMISSFFKNQISAFLTSSVLFFVLNLLGSDFFAINLPIQISNVISRLSLIDNYSSLTRGAYDFSNLVYFLIIFILGVVIAYSNIQKVRLSNVGSIFKNTFGSILLLAFISAAIIYSSQYAKGRIDFTQNKKYTLSNVTKDILKSEGKIKIDVYASNDLPPQFQSVYRELKNVLEDYKFIGGSNVELQFFDPKTQTDALTKLGIQPIRFNIIGNDELQSKEGYLAVVVSNDDVSKQEKIDFVQNVDNLEYNLTNLINKIKQKDKPKVAFTTGNDEKNPFTDYSALSDVVQSYYNIQQLVIPGRPTDEELKQNKNKQKDVDKEVEKLDLNDIKALVIADPKKEFDAKATKKLIDFYNNGGSILYIVDALDIQQQSMIASKPAKPKGGLFTELGAKVNQDLVYDLRSNLPVNISGGRITYMVSYPYFIRAVKGKDNNVAGFPSNVVITWPSSIDLSDDFKVLYSTTQYGSKTDSLSINPQQNFDTSKQSQVPLIAYKTNDKGGKFIIASSSSVLSNDTVSRFEENAIFGSSIIEFLASSTNLSQIKAKGFNDNRFTTVDDVQKLGVRVLAPAISILVLLVIAGWRIFRRKMLATRYA